LKLKGVELSAPSFPIFEEGRNAPVKIYEVNGRKVWLDPETAPAGAKPLEAPKKTQQAAPEPVKEEPETKAKKTPANKSRKAGGNK
jgi:hypothetical protein